MKPSEFTAARRALEMTQEELAKAWGVSTQNIRNKEAGRNPIFPRDALALEALKARAGR